MTFVWAVIGVTLAVGLPMWWLMWRMDRRFRGLQADLDNAIRVVRKATGED